MGIHVAIRHRTEYHFDRLVTIYPHILRLRPAPHCRTPILAYSLKVAPQQHFLNWQQDPFANHLARLVFQERAQSLLVDVEVIADLTVIDPFDFFVEESAERWPFRYPAALAKELAPYLECEAAGPLLQTFLHGLERQEQNTVLFLVALNQRLQKTIDYSVRMEPGVQSCEETLSRHLGSCRDTGWLLVQILRHLGLAARFVSGYLVQLVADEKPLEGPAGPAQDFTDLHAWAEVYLPGAGWVGLDPTSGLFAGEGHIPLACTPQPSTAAPIVGATDPCKVTFTFNNTVTRIRETPRVTKPYSERQWAAILDLGQRVDARLAAGDVRLTMGGEPTFVAVDARDTPEWSNAALGEQKRERAEILVRKLQRDFAPGSLLHSGEGKWYPGEALPRWALGLYWRKDGIPVWRDAGLLSVAGRDSGRTLADAERFAGTLTRYLGVAEQFVLTAYEDALHYLRQEAELPVNLDLAQLRLDDARERRSLADKLSRGLDQPVGFVVPLAWDETRETWRSAAWTFRRGRLILIPGDSPLGLRLPLDALPWVAEEDREMRPEVDPFASHMPLPDIQGEVAARYSRFVPSPTAPEKTEAPADAGVSPREIPHTALAIEPRGGGLYVFLPPLERLEHALDLVAAIEATAARLRLPVVLEGYPPPSDTRLEKLLVTPDPGVIEVNIHPSRSWAELVANTDGVYEAARQSRLGAEKFMLDGRHTGTGGGNHITLSGNTPGDSPFLRRPDLLQSLITYWQHHPALSYFFSGLFVGPTSQAPRVDEGRHEALYELEIAFAQIAPREAHQPWLVDRLFRNLLVDVTGNTHRAEICIDKLFSPSGPAGRQGLVELRAFEMPPHARMSLVQQLLVRTLLLRFWENPYRHALMRWGTELHDRFLLPHYLWEDLREILLDLQAHDLPFDPAWFEPFLEFRFPVYGQVQIGDIGIELRAAIEPWHVLGEEATGQGTARYVDSSVERLQVLLSGLSDKRHVLACNGRRIPLRKTGTPDQEVAGVRYRAWQPPSALHPTIPVHSPLVFDLIDTWNGRSIGGCTFHVMHPGGRNFAQYPVNAWEAEARRQSRFERIGHTPGPYTPPPAIWARGPVAGRFVPEGSHPGVMDAPPVETNPDYPAILDLRLGGALPR
ncbi:MAG: transglutaminase family protein [Methylacidiphilaceae bacterium]|nr:transglutaminase family protein [Candidatus Methylacidiphilaceae bacterium]